MKLKDQIKIVVFDYDGTLVDYHRQMSDKTIEALNLLKKNGYKLAIASGRMCRIIGNIISEYTDYRVFDYFFGANGSEYLVIDKNDYVSLNSLSSEEIKSIVMKLDGTIGVPSVYNPYHCYVPINTKKERYSEFEKYIGYNFEQFDFSQLQDTFPKVLYFFEEKDYDKAYEVLSSNEFSNYSLVRSNKRILELLPKGVSKANCIKLLTELENVDSRQIMAFGDEQNDLSMMQSCVGVAMGNARDEIKRKVDYIAPNVNEDGIYGFFKEHEFI